LVSCPCGAATQTGKPKVRKGNFLHAVIRVFDAYSHVIAPQERVSDFQE